MAAARPTNAIHHRHWKTLIFIATHWVGVVLSKPMTRSGNHWPACRSNKVAGSTQLPQKTPTITPYADAGQTFLKVMMHDERNRPFRSRQAICQGEAGARDRGGPFHGHQMADIADVNFFGIRKAFCKFGDIGGLVKNVIL